MAEKATITGFRSETVALNGTRLHYWIGGPTEGRPVLLWHGFLSTAFAWRDVATALAQQGFSVLAPDMRGFGDSDKPEGTDGYDARSLAEEFRGLIADIGFGGGRPLIVAAHDMGAPPALIWAADHADEIAGLIYIEAPVMLDAVLGKAIAYNRPAMARGSMWWWILPLAPGVPERLIVGNERAFLTWFYEGDAARPEVFTEAVVDEYLRTFSGRTGVLGALGTYRAAFDSIDQTTPLQTTKVEVPVVALGGEKGLGAEVAKGLALVASDVTGETLPGSGHFVPEEEPGAVVRHVVALANRPN